MNLSARDLAFSVVGQQSNISLVGSIAFFAQPFHHRSGSGPVMGFMMSVAS